MKKNLLQCLLLAIILLLPHICRAQADNPEMYGWLRFDTRNQDEYGICKFVANAPEEINVLYPHDPEEVACAGAFADNKYYVYLYRPVEGGATPLTFNYVNLATGEFKQVADYREMPMLYSDMTYDYSTKTMYALAKKISGSVLLKVNLTDGKYIEVGPMGDEGRLFVTLACSYEGELYAIDGDEGHLWKVDKDTGATDDVGYTWEEPEANFLQSMEFDHSTNILYWALNNIYDEGALATINLETGEAARTGMLGNDAQVVGLYIPFKKTDANAPAAISDLTIIPGEKGALTADISWLNPSTTFSGGKLTSLNKIQIYRNDVLAKEINNPEIGKKASYKDEEMQNGFSTYRIQAVNEKGESEAVSQTVFIGRDVPVAPAKATLTALDKKSAKITWEAPSEGVNGGWVDLSTIAYKVTRLPDNYVVAESTSDVEVIDLSIQVLNNYSYEIQSMTADGMGGKTVTNSLIIGPSLSVPYRCDFATDELFALWNIVDANQDGYSWRRETTLNAALYHYNEDDTTPGDDWLISSPIHLEKGKIYRLSFKLQSYDVNYTERVGVYLGTGKTIAEQTMLLGEFVPENEYNAFSSHRAMLPEVMETGDYHLSFHCHSDPAMWILYLTDILLEEVREGGISGVVTDKDGNGVPDVKVLLKETDRKVMTDENGGYKLEELMPATYTLLFSKTGYQQVEEKGCEVNDGETTFLNAMLTELPVYSVSGKIVNSSNQPVLSAKVSLTGYADYSVTTDADGLFSFPEVYQSDDYELIVERYGLRNDTLSVEVKDANVRLEDLILKDKLLPPGQLKVNVTDRGAVVSWQVPVDTRIFRHDNGIHSGRLGTTASTAKSVYGSVFRTPAKLTGMTWFTENYLLAHHTVNLFVFDLNSEGEPTSEILYSKMNVPNTDMQWTTFEFETPVDAPNGYMLALSYEGHVGLGLDNGEGPDHPFEPHTNCYSEDYTTGRFIYTEEHDIKRSLMIRGIGVLRGEDELPVATTGKKYAVWRLTQEQKETPELWQRLTSDPIDANTYTDTDWQLQKQGYYQYAVKAFYNKDTEVSDAAFSEVLVKDMLTRITVNVKTNTPQNESKGAKITLTNLDNNIEHVYEAIADKDGKAVLPDVWKGVYRVTIDLKGFETFVRDTEDFSTESRYEPSDYILKEYIVNPFNLEIVKTGVDQQRLFNWNVADFLFDDFESHMDFVINSSGSIGWEYVDDDGKETYGVDGVDYINATLPMAYMIFNPYETDPTIGIVDSHIRPFSGEKFLGAFPAHPAPNNDFIISPELNFHKDFTFKFYAKSYTEDYGAEQMNVGYSTTGKAITDFSWLNGDEPIDLPMGEWLEYKYTIPAEAKYVTINCVSDNIFIFMVDDVFIGMEVPEGVDLQKMKDDLSFEVYLDGKSLGTTQSTGYVLNDLTKGRHRAGVKAIFSSVTTPLAEIEFDVEEASGIAENETAHWSITPNPANDMVNISGAYDHLIIYDLSGNEIRHHDYMPQISVAALPEGMYFIKIVSGKYAETLKLIVGHSR